MPTLWELIPDTSISWDVPSQQNLPPSAGSYGDRNDIDMNPPVRSVSFRARGLTLSDVDSLIASRTRGVAYSVTDYKGRAYSGTLLAISYSVLPGTVLHTVTLTLRV